MALIDKEMWVWIRLIIRLYFTGTIMDQEQMLWRNRITSYEDLHQANIYIITNI